MNDQVNQLAGGPTAFLMAVAAISLLAVLGLRRTMPNRPRLAMFLAIFFGPAGHLYLPGAFRYVVLMYAAWIGLIAFTPLPITVSGFLLTVLSALLMRARLLAEKNKGPADAPPAP